MNRPEWLEDARFITPALRDKNAAVRLELIQEALLTNSAEYWLEALERAGVPCAPVLTRAQMLRHPQVAASEIVVQTEHEHAGRLRQTRNAARFEITSAEHRLGAPHLGEHTQSTLTELGLSNVEIEALEAEGVVSRYAAS